MRRFLVMRSIGFKKPMEVDVELPSLAMAKEHAAGLIEAYRGLVSSQWRVAIAEVLGEEDSQNQPPVCKQASVE